MSERASVLYDIPGPKAKRVNLIMSVVFGALLLLLAWYVLTTLASKNQLTAGVALIMGIADFTFALGGASFGGIILGTVAAIVVYHLMTVVGRLRGTD